MPISVPIVWVHSFIEPDVLKTMYTFRQYHSDLSDQSALDLGLFFGFDTELH